MSRPNKNDYIYEANEHTLINFSYYIALEKYCDELEQKYADACIDYRQLCKKNKMSWDTKAHRHHKDILNEIYSANKYYMTEQAKDAMLDAIECLDKAGEEDD